VQPSPCRENVGLQQRVCCVLTFHRVAERGCASGAAKAAELNGYPGPAHVLELGGDLALSAEQRARTQAVWQAMDARARALGQQVVDAERELDALFASKQVTRERLGEQLDRIGVLQAQLRAVHLEAHLRGRAPRSAPARPCTSKRTWSRRASSRRSRRLGMPRGAVTPAPAGMAAGTVATAAATNTDAVGSRSLHCSPR
jgi:hypothetical protein